MVGTRPSRDDRPARSERAQLLLVGAIAIGLVLLGLVVVFNTVLFTEATTPTETLESGDEAEVLNQQIRNDTRRIILAVENQSASSNCANSSTLCDQIRTNITRYSRGLTASKAQTGPVYVDVEVLGVNDSAGNGFGAFSCTEDLCAQILVRYETEEFTWARIQVVEADTS